MQVVRDESGKLQRVTSWDSHGSDLLRYAEAPPASAAPAAGNAPAQPARTDSGDEVTSPGANGGGVLKIRRVGTKDVVYTRMEDANRGAAPLPAQA